MLGRSLSIASAVMLGFCAVPSAAAPPLGGWKIEPSSTQCVAVRRYGAPDKATSLIIKKSLIEDSVQVGILRIGFRTRPVQTETMIKMGDHDFATTALSYQVGGDKRRVAHLINLDAEQYAALRKASEVAIDVREGVDETFPLGDMSAVWTGLEQCVGRVGDIWNVGEEREQRFEQGPRGDLQSLFSPEDYPVVAARSDQQGTTGFLILIDEQGLPKDCTVFQTSGSALIDSRSCGVIIARGKFSPAIGKDGKPMKSAFRKRVAWRLR